MTRIIFQWMLVFIIGGISLLVSGESTVSTTSEEKTPNSVSSLILSTAENTSSEINSKSVASLTENSHEESENLVSTTSNIELDEPSKTSAPLDGSKTHNSVDSEVLTTLFSTDPSSEESKVPNSANSTEEHTGEYEGHKEMVLTSKENLNSDKEFETGTDLQDAEDASDNSFTSDSNVISETSTNILNTISEIQSENASLSTKSSEEGTEEVHTDITSMEGSKLFKAPGRQTAMSGNTHDHSERLSPTKAAGSTLPVSESTTYETEIVTTIDYRDKATSENLSTENLLSLHKTTPKSATKKRSLNNTGDSILHRESTSTLDTFSSTSLQPELITLLEHIDSSTSESADAKILTKSNISEAITVNEASIQNVNNNAAEPSSVAYVSTISSELGTIRIMKEKGGKFDFPHFNPEKSPENYSTLSVKEQKNLDGKETSEMHMETEKFQSEVSLNIPKATEADSHLNNLDNVDNNFSGVTFDPDGMKNDEPQDPDSVVFYVPSTNFDKVSTPENSYPETEHESSESEREFEFVTHKDVMEGSSYVVKTGESEKMVNMPQDKTMNIYPQPSHNPIDTPKIETFETSNNSNSSSGFVFWDPSNGGWILPGNSTDTQIKRIDAELNEESEEMLQDAPHFPETVHTQNKSPSSNSKTGSNEEETKTTIGDVTSNFNKELEPEVVTELGFVEFSNSFVPHHTDQSVIRPVKIKLTSPDDETVTTSILPESFSTLTSEQPNGLKLSEPTTEIMIEKIETSSINSSSPIILPNLAPSVTTELVKIPELSTIVVQPELVPVSLDKSIPEATETSNSTSVANSTIAGIAVKTSVSVSLPLSNTKNDSLTPQPPLIDEKLVELMKSLNVSSLTINGSTIYIPPGIRASSTPTPSDSSTDGLTITSDQTTTESGFRIRKPKIRIPGGSDSFTPRPFRPNPKKPITTAGPPVSIFKKQRTRIASITSSTTARPLRNFNFNGNFATVKIQYASDIPGLLPQEFLISTEPITTTTPEPTTTEEPISEVPFADQTHIPTVANEDDVTLVKVAGYVVIDRGLRWNDLLHNRHSPEYRKSAEAMHLYLERMFRSSPIASRLWKIEIDGFSGNKKTRPVGIDFFLYLIKTKENIPTEHLAMVFHEKLSVNNTFGTFRVDPSKTAFEMIQEQPLKAPTPLPEEENIEPPIPQWAIAVIVIGAASLIFIVLFATVTIYGRHHMRRRYSSKLSEEDMERSSGEWESKMAAAYENMAADTIYDAEDLHSDSYKKNSRIATFHGIPTTLKRCDSWSSNGWTTPPKRKRPPVH